MWWRVGLSLGLLFILLFFLVDLETTWAYLRSADPLYLGLLLVWLTGDRLLMSYKWTLLLNCRGLRLGQGQALRAYYMGTFAGSFMPTTLGADALRVGVVSSPERPSEVVAASVVMERALGLVASALAALLALELLTGLAVQGAAKELSWTVLLTLALAGGTVAALLLSLSSSSGRLVERLEVWLAAKGRLAGWLGKFMAAYHQYRQHPLALGLFLLLSFLEQASPVLANWLAARALGIELSLLAAAAATPVAIALARLPIWFSGFGVVEGLFVFFFALVGLGASEAFLLGLATNVSSLAAALPGLYFYLAGGFKRRAQSKENGS